STSNQKKAALKPLLIFNLLSLFLYDQEFVPSVLCMLLLGAVCAAVNLRFALTEAFARDACLGDSFGDYVLYRRARPSVRKVHVVSIAAPVVGVALDHDHHLRVLGHHLYQLVKFEGALTCDVALV